MSVSLEQELKLGLRRGGVCLTNEEARVGAGAGVGMLWLRAVAKMLVRSLMSDDWEVSSNEMVICPPQHNASRQAILGDQLSLADLVVVDTFLYFRESQATYPQSQHSTTDTN